MAKITVHTRGSSVEFEGDVEVAMAPNGALIVQEVSPDIAGGKPEGKLDMRGMFPPNEWVRVHCE